jgi:hypothetical protein
MRYPQKIGKVGLALVAMLLLGAMSAGTASAAKFEASPSFPLKFTGKGGAGLLETKGGHSVTCTSAEASGEISGATAIAGVSVRFKGCFAEHLPALPCTTSGKASGEIWTNTIVGKPVNLDTLGVQVGLLLEPSAGAFAEFTCKSSVGPIPVEEEVTVTGSLIGQFKTTQLNEFRSTLNLEFVQAKGVQAWTQVEGAGASHFLLTEGEGTAPFAPEQSGVGEAVPGETTTTALEGKQIKVVP